MRQIVSDVNSLKENDMISILLFGLYKLTGDPDYSAISELAYTLDKKSLINLCSIYGGTTIKIPTLKELKTISKSLYIVDEMYHGKSFDEAYASAKIDDNDRETVIKAYDVLSNILNEYEKQN